MKDKVIAVILLIILLAAMIYSISAFDYAHAEDEHRFILCHPDSYVIVRRNPTKRSEEAGYLECGDRIETDGKTKNGFIHCIGITEYGEGWVFAGYVVDDQPVICDSTAKIAASGRVACYKWVNSKRNKWAANGANIAVYAYSEEWAVTSKGFVRMKYLEAQDED